MATEKVTLPSAPSYTTLMLDFPAVMELTSPSDIEDGIVPAPLVANEFKAKNAHVEFSQKVISIVLLQTVAVNMIMEIFLYSEIFLHDIDSIHLSMVALVLFSISLVLMLLGIKDRRKAVCNFIILVYHPIGPTIAAILVMRALLGVGYYGQELLEMIYKTWKSCVFSGVGIMIYSIFCLNSKHGIWLLYSLSITTGIFTCSYICNSIVCFMNEHTGSAALTIFYANLVFYPLYSYILYDIDAMTKRDYRAARGPTDYINGAANLQLDFIFIIINFIKITCMKKQ